MRAAARSSAGGVLRAGRTVFAQLLANFGEVGAADDADGGDLQPPRDAQPQQLLPVRAFFRSRLAQLLEEHKHLLFRFLLVAWHCPYIEESEYLYNFSLNRLITIALTRAFLGTVSVPSTSNRTIVFCPDIAFVLHKCLYCNPVKS